MNKMKEDESRQLVPSMNDLCDESRFPEPFNRFIYFWILQMDRFNREMLQQVDQGTLEAGLTDQ